MADPFELLPQLAGAYAQQRQAENPYFQIAGNLAKTKFDIQDPWSALAANLGQNLVAGGANRVAQNQYQGDISDAYSQLAASLSGRSVTPELAPYAANLKTAKAAEDFAREQKRQDQIFGAGLDLTKDLNMESIKYGATPEGQLDLANGGVNPYSRTLDNVRGNLLNLTGQEAPIFNAEAPAETNLAPAPPPPPQALDIEPGKTNQAQTIPSIQDIQAEKGISYSAAKLEREQLVKEAEREKKNLFDLEEAKNSLRKEFQATTSFKDFEVSQKGYRSLQKAIKDKSGASDLEITRGAVQAVEPGLSVREGEQAAAANSGAFPDKWKTFIIGSLTTGQKLPDEVREGLMRIVERRFTEHKANFELGKKYYTSEAKARGLPRPESITFMEELPLDNPNIVTAPNGKQYIFTD